MSTEPGFHEWKRTCPACSGYALDPEGYCSRCGYDAAEDYEERRRKRLAEASED